jgi:hypothetical protein
MNSVEQIKWKNKEKINWTASSKQATVLIVFSSEEEIMKFSRKACWTTDKSNYLPTLCLYWTLQTKLTFVSL